LKRSAAKLSVESELLNGSDRGTCVESDETKQDAARRPADTEPLGEAHDPGGLWRAAGGNGASSDAARKAGGSVKQAAADIVEMIVR
jgi:hypothetical protein